MQPEPTPPVAQVIDGPTTSEWMVSRIMQKLSDAVPIRWDRYTKTDDGFYVVYGWITRRDGDRDFVIFELWTNDSESLFCTTSSAKYSRSITAVLYGESEDHNDCRKIEELLTGDAQPGTAIQRNQHQNTVERFCYLYAYAGVEDTYSNLRRKPVLAIKSVIVYSSVVCLLLMFVAGGWKL